MSDDQNSKEGAFVAHTDPDLEDLIPGYLKNRKTDVVDILNALERHDFNFIKRVTHSMKGSGGGYGFDPITKLGASIEEAAKQNNSEAIRRSVEELSHYLECVEIVVDSD